MEENKVDKTRCDCCDRKLTNDNCTAITGTCDDCLADKAADDRQEEWENGYGYE